MKIKIITNIVLLLVACLTVFLSACTSSQHVILQKKKSWKLFLGTEAIENASSAMRMDSSKDTPTESLSAKLYYLAEEIARQYPDHERVRFFLTPNISMIKIEGWKGKEPKGKVPPIGNAITAWTLGSLLYYLAIDYWFIPIVTDEGIYILKAEEKEYDFDDIAIYYTNKEDASYMPEFAPSKYIPRNQMFKFLDIRSLNTKLINGMPVSEDLNSFLELEPKEELKLFGYSYLVHGGFPIILDDKNESKNSIKFNGRSIKDVLDEFTESKGLKMAISPKGNCIYLCSPKRADYLNKVSRLLANIDDPSLDIALEHCCAECISLNTMIRFVSQRRIELLDDKNAFKVELIRDLGTNDDPGVSGIFDGEPIREVLWFFLVETARQVDVSLVDNKLIFRDRFRNHNKKEEPE